MVFLNEELALFQQSHLYGGMFKQDGWIFSKFARIGKYTKDMPLILLTIPETHCIYYHDFSHDFLVNHLVKDHLDKDHLDKDYHHKDHHDKDHHDLLPHLLTGLAKQALACFKLLQLPLQVVVNLEF